MPIFIYSKVYIVDIDSFYEAFPSIIFAKGFKKYFLIIGIILIIILAAISLFLNYKYTTHKRARISINRDWPENTNLINDSRDVIPTKEFDID